MMNKFYTLIFALLLSTTAWAQKGSIGKAQAYLDKGDLANAKAEIDVAVSIEKHAAKSRTWILYGDIYQAIATSDDMAVSSIDKEALSKASDAFRKVVSMEKKNSLNAANTDLKIESLWGHFMNKGQEAYNVDNRELALSNFEKALLPKPKDSLASYYSGAMAQETDDFEKAEKYYTMLKDNWTASESVYQSLIYFKRVKDKNEEALTLVNEAKAKYPNNKTFVNEELTILIVLNKLDEAETKLKAALSDDPSVVQNHLNLAVLYDNLATKFSDDGEAEKSNEKFDLAIKSYQNAVDLDPNNYVGNFNLGAIYVNRAKVYLDEARAMDLNTYQKKGAALEEKAKVDLKKAQPYFEKVVIDSPDDVTALSTLQTIYSSLKMYDKAEEIMNRVEALEGK